MVSDHILLHRKAKKSVVGNKVKLLDYPSVIPAKKAKARLS